MGRRSSAAPVVLENTCKIPFISHPATETPTAPASTPTYEIRDAAGLASGTPIVSGTATALSGVTGGYYVSHAITAANGFAAGTTYYVVVEYTISSVDYTDLIDMPVA